MLEESDFERQEAASHLEESPAKSEVSEEIDNLPKRNLFITYKAFPTREKMVTSVMYNESTPIFQHGSQFPIMMTH